MKAKKVASYGILVALAIALSYLETLIPWTVAAPGVKLGLANTVTILALYRLSFRDACAISLLRVLLVGILFGQRLQPGFQRCRCHRQLGGDAPPEPCSPGQHHLSLRGRRGGPQRRADLGRWAADPRLADCLVFPRPLSDRHPGRHRHRPALRLCPAADPAHHFVTIGVSPVRHGETLCLFSTNCQFAHGLLLAIPVKFG